MLLCGLYLFFVRVLWSVFSELRDPRTMVRKNARGAKAQKGTPAQAAAAGASFASNAQNVAPPASPASAGAGGASGGGAGAGVAIAAPALLGELVVVDPPQHAGVTYVLGPEITVGRAPTNGIVLDDTYVSTVHVRIFATRGTYFIEDLASRNGTMLNDQPLVATTALLPGDILQIGATSLEFG